ncbi:MAG TPA: sialidase family protein [Nitrososphaeraceae archaeon]|nr:sialidase family protein [Nitrososphaeraceae archaeon]
MTYFLLLFGPINSMYLVYAQDSTQPPTAPQINEGRPLSIFGPISPFANNGTNTLPNGTNTLPNGTNTLPPTTPTSGNPNGTNTLPNGTNTLPNGTNTLPSSNDSNIGSSNGNPESFGGGGGTMNSNNNLASLNQTGLGANIPSPSKPVIFTKNLSNNSGISDEQKIAVGGNNVYVVWKDTTSGNGDVLFARSPNNGATFGKATNLSNSSTGESLNPKVTAFRNNVYVVWEDTSSSNGTSDILFAKSADNGATFSSATNLSNNLGESSNPQIFASGNNVYVVWEDTTSGNGDILFARSPNNGATFGKATNLSNNLGKAGSEPSDPQIFASGNNVYVVWKNSSPTGTGSILFARSPNNGATFSNATNLSNNLGESSNPQIFASGNNVYVVWEDYPLANALKNQILFARSTSNGSTFENIISINNSTGESLNPKVTAFRNNVYVVWEDTSSSDSNSDILFARSPNNGATFGKAIKVTVTPSRPSDPQIFASENNVYLTWIDHDVATGNDIVVFAKSPLNGIQFTDIRSISNAGGESASPQIMAYRNNVYIVWTYDDTATANSTSGNTDIFFLRGYNGNFPGSSPVVAPSAEFGQGSSFPGSTAPALTQSPSSGFNGSGSEFGQGSSFPGSTAPALTQSPSGR